MTCLSIQHSTHYERLGDSIFCKTDSWRVWPETQPETRSPFFLIRWWAVCLALCVIGWEWENGGSVGQLAVVAWVLTHALVACKIKTRPDRTSRNSRTSKSADRLILWSLLEILDQFCGSHIVECPVGYGYKAAARYRWHFWLTKKSLDDDDVEEEAYKKQAKHLKK